MVKVTFEQDGQVEDVTSGEFVLAIIGTKGEKSLKGIFRAFGQTDDKSTALAVASIIRNTVREAIDPDTRVTAYKFLRETINVELERLEKEETPEAATPGESSK